MDEKQEVREQLKKTLEGLTKPQSLNHKVNFGPERLELDRRYCALHEAVNYVVGMPTIGGVTATIRDTVKIAEKFEEYLKTGSIE